MLQYSNAVPYMFYQYIHKHNDVMILVVNILIYFSTFLEFKLNFV